MPPRKKVEPKDKATAVDKVNVELPAGAGQASTPEITRTPRKTFKKTSDAKRYVGVKVVMWHPVQMVRIPTGNPGALLTFDSWVEVQVNAGLLKEV